MKQRLGRVIKAHQKTCKDSDVLYGELTKAAAMESGDIFSIARAKRLIVAAAKSSKEWVQVFEMYMQFDFKIIAGRNPLSEAQIIADMNDSARSLEVLLEACENAKVLTRHSRMRMIVYKACENALELN